jgi:hypothetical protein
MATTEHTINDALATVLRETRRAWSAPGVISSENTGMLKGSSKRPDVLVLEANVSPVVIETEVLPAGAKRQVNNSPSICRPGCGNPFSPVIATGTALMALFRSQTFP